MEKDKALDIINKISLLFPDAHCELNYHNVFELVVATILSAQTTDKVVNTVTPTLFNKYPDCKALSKANINEVIDIIKGVGLANNKAKNIINLSIELVNNYNSIVPNDFDSLVKLPGIGRKTANVILSEGFGLPGLAVDTHVSRVSYKLALTKEKDPEKIEKELKELYEPNIWGDVHLKLLFFGRYFCIAKKPNCDKCPFKNECIDYKI